MQEENNTPDLPEGGEPSGRNSKDASDEKALSFSFRRFVINLLRFLKNVFNLKEGVDFEGTAQGIRQDVQFKGHAAWILICSILIASIGLNTNSVAVIIGAMLISPLMGPILAIGMAIAINDFELLKRAVKNFTVAVGISLLISTIYFIITPFKDPSPELMDRRNATLLALGVALFGGAAGIIAGSRPQKSNVVPGVAIATALMPPLCTAGYGIATFQWDYFFGAFYLFFINSVFIAVPTYLYIRYMGFPVVEFVDPLREKRIKRYILLFLGIVIIPSGIIFVQVLQQSLFFQRANRFVLNVEESLQGTETAIITRNIDYNDGEPEIRIALMGDVVDENKVEAWKLQLESFDLKECAFDVVQSKDYMSAIRDIEEKTAERGTRLLENMIQMRDEEIRKLQLELQRLSAGDLNFDQLQKESRVLFRDVTKLMYTSGVETNFSTRDTVHTLFIQFDPGTPQEKRMEEMSRMREWLSVQTGKENVRVIEY